MYLTKFIIGIAIKWKCIVDLWWLVGCHWEQSFCYNCCELSYQRYSTKIGNDPCTEIWNNLSWHSSVLSLISPRVNNDWHPDFCQYLLKKSNVQHTPKLSNHHKSNPCTCHIKRTYNLILIKTEPASPTKNAKEIQDECWNNLYVKVLLL